MRRDEAIRLLGLCAQCEIALVRRDLVVVALLAQASRAAPEGVAATALARAASMARASDLLGDTGEARAARKAVQALNRIATQEAQAVALAEQDLRHADAWRPQMRRPQGSPGDSEASD